LERSRLRRSRRQNQCRHGVGRDRGRTQFREGHLADRRARRSWRRRASRRRSVQGGRASAHRQGRGHRGHDSEAGGLPARTGRRAARSHRRRPDQARPAPGAVHRVWHRNDGHAVSSVTKSIPELADRYLVQTGRRLPVTFVRGRGCLVYDDAGNEYLDLVAGIAVNLLGHAHPEVAAAVAQQAKTLIHTSNLYFTQPQVELARRLVELSFPSRVFFCNSGAEANETAIKLARKWGARNRDGAFQIITTLGSFHGRTLATVTAGGQPKYSDPFKPLPDGFMHVPYNDLDAIKAATSTRTVAVMLEPVMGEIGIVP